MSYQTQASEVYAWLQDHPVGAYIVVEDAVAAHVMLTQGGLLYRDDLWHSIRWSAMSPGVGNLTLMITPYKDRVGAGPRAWLSNADTALAAGVSLRNKSERIVDLEA